ncbi:MAG: hypothetical protein ACE37I_13310 [Rubinisphaera brasiliensis]|uniref:hypothetical protein n=1 Tax=Rubinisphaera brasiliensis TaxID=119 RepID=UPI00391A513D
MKTLLQRLTALRLPRLRKSRPTVRKRSWLGFCFESITALLIVAGGIALVVAVAVLWGWSQRDEFLTSMIRKELAEKHADWNISFANAELDHRGRVVLANVTVNPHGDAEPLCAMQGLRVTVDRELLLDHGKVDVKAVEVNRPKLTLIRTFDGQWNWQNLPLTGDNDKPVPLIKIRDACVAVVWEHAEFERALRLQVDAVDVDLTPTSQHGYTFKGVGREETLGQSQFSGTFDARHKTWELTGHLKGLSIDQPFLQAAAMLSPDAERVISRLGESQFRKDQPEIPGSSPNSNANEIRTAQLKEPAVLANTAASRITVGDNAFSLKLLANLQFHCSRQLDAEADFSVFADLVSGQLEHPDIPMPLDRIRGQIAVDRRGIRFEQMQLASGRMSAEVSGAWNWIRPEQQAAANADELLVTLKNYQVSPQTRDFLPHSLHNLFDELNPAGELSISFGLRRGEDRPIDFDLYNAQVRNASIRHQMFSYPVSGIQGTIVRTDHGIGPEAWALEMSGLAAEREVTATGTVLDPGPDCETVFDVNVEQLPIDDQFYRALRPNERDTMKYIGLQGMADVHCVIVRKLELGRKPIIRLDADVYQAALQVKSFPLGIRELSGHVNMDESGWQFTRLTGLHGDTRVNGFGTVVPEGNEWRLGLTVSAQQAHFDHDLYLAMKSTGSEVSCVWDLLRPRGDFGVTVNIGWLSGQESVKVDVPLMKLHNCEFNPTVFPWRMSDIEATVAINSDGTVAFENLKAKHDQSRIETSGTFALRENYWQLRFEKLIVDDLFPDQELLAALPKTTRQLLESTQLQHPCSVTGMLEFKGDYEGEVVTAAWDTKVVFNQIDLFLGVEIDQASGSAELQGLMDRNGVVTVPRGRIAIDSCWVLGYHVTDVKGPLKVTPDEIVLGSAKMFEPESPEEEWATVSRDERMTGRIFGGELFLDLMARRTTSMPYWLRCTLSRADLEQWAIESNYGQADIKGEVNGYIDLAGDAVSERNMVGNGRLLISPAALYELPVMLQMFQSLRFAPVDDTAFRDAYAQFRILDEKFVFDEIGLLGDSMSLFGQGTIRFDRTIDLDFVYRPARRGGINLASQVLNRLEGVLPVLFTVEVEGTVDVPKVKVQDGVRETLRGFAKMLEVGPSTLRPPRILPPPRVRIQTPPQAAQPLVPSF